MHKTRQSPVIVSFRPGKRLFELFIQTTIVVSLVAMTLETVGSLPAPVRSLMEWISVACLAVFVMEYGLRLWFSPRPLSYVFSVWGIIDVVAILPALLLFVEGTVALRALLLIRLVRLFKLYRSNRALQRLGAAFVQTRDELFVMLAVAFLVFFVASAGIYTFEHDAQPDAFPSIPAAMWWAVATLTTVGYGDVYPVTAAGKVFTGVILIIGLGLVAVPTGLIAAALQEQSSENEKKDDASA